MPVVYLSLGSNIDRERNIHAGLTMLADHFGALTLSPVYESEAVGFEGDAFLNLVVKIETALSVGDLLAVLREIERVHGRVRGEARFASRSLDIDILTYDALTGVHDSVTLPRDEILKHAFVLKPLADIAPDVLHPIEKKTFSELLAERDFTGQRLWPVAFAWP